MVSRKEPSKSSSIALNYGGNVKSGWVAHLPDSWIPYVQLARLNPPAGYVFSESFLPFQAVTESFAT